MAKCAAYLQRGIGVVIVDVVTNRLVNLHNQLMKFIGGTPQTLLVGDPASYVASYRPVHRDTRNEIDTWPYPVALESALPTTPFALRRGPTVMLDLESTYMEAIGDLGL
jgi:hypothetical protein